MKLNEQWREDPSQPAAPACPAVSGHQPSTPHHQPTYGIRKHLAFWAVDFEGQTAVFDHEKGALYVAYLLLNPPSEPIHGMALELKANAYFRQRPDGPSETLIVDPLTGATLTIGAFLIFRDIQPAQRPVQTAVINPTTTGAITVATSGDLTAPKTFVDPSPANFDKKIFNQTTTQNYPNAYLYIAKTATPVATKRFLEKRNLPTNLDVMAKPNFYAPDTKTINDRITSSLKDLNWSEANAIDWGGFVKQYK